MKRLACIYIGSERIELIIAQRGANKKAHIIDHALYPLQFDYEIFQNGFISTSSNQLLERVFKEYLRLAKENMPDKIQVIFSNEISRAENFLFIYYRINDLLEDQNALILTNEDELELFCIISELNISENFDVSSTNIMMAAINANQINFSLTNNGFIDFTEQIPYGYLKLSEMVETITKERTHYSKLLSEIIENKLRLAISHIGKRKLKYVSLTTKDAEIIAQNFKHDQKGELFIFNKDTINEAYHSIKELTPEQIRTRYPNLTEAQSITLQSTIIVARQLINTAKTDQIFLIKRDLAKSIVELQFKLTKQRELSTWIEEGSYQSVIAVSERYNVDQRHAELVEKYSLQLYSALKKRYALSKKEKRYLALAARLLDIGQFGGEDGQARASEEIILREDIIGLSQAERRIIARVCYNVKVNDYDKTMDTREFSMDESLIIAQLTAIIKLASTLDQSRKNKVGKLTYSLKDSELIVKVTTTHNTQLENYYFNRDSKWVERIYDLKPVLKVKRIKV